MYVYFDNLHIPRQLLLDFYFNSTSILTKVDLRMNIFGCNFSHV